jgi:hypothetical protein
MLIMHQIYRFCLQAILQMFLPGRPALPGLDAAATAEQRGSATVPCDLLVRAQLWRAARPNAGHRGGAATVDRRPGRVRAQVRFPGHDAAPPSHIVSEPVHDAELRFE